MKVRYHIEDTIRIFEFSGASNDKVLGEVFDGITKVLADVSDRRVVFVLSDLDMINSRMIGYISSFYYATHDTGGYFGVCNSNEAINDALMLCGIDQLVHVSSSLPLAMKRALAFIPQQEDDNKEGE